MQKTVYDPMGKATDVFAYAENTAESKVSAHNTESGSHSDIRELITGLTNRLNALADSDDTTLDQMSEIVAYIKSNKSLIDAITTSKVSVSDIIDNLATSASNKPLSAAQGVALKALIDAISIPDKLPNPNALTFTGAVTGIYDGSSAVTVHVPSGGGSGGTDISLGVTGAIVGQIAKITAVDDNGVPTAWEAIDVPSGEGGTDFTLLSTVEVGQDELVAYIRTPTVNELSGYKEMICIFKSYTRESDGTEITVTQSLRPFAVGITGIGENGRISGDVGNCVGNTSESRTAILYITNKANFITGYIGNNYSTIQSVSYIRNSARVFDRLPQIDFRNNKNKYYSTGTKLEVYVK